MTTATPTRQITRPRWPALALVLLPLAVAVWLYGRTLPLPYFWDDFPHYNFATAKSFVAIWTDVTGAPYYRPIIFTLYKILFGLLPPGQTAVPHLLVLLIHAANSALTGKLAGKLYRGGTPPARTAVELLAALLFVVYPFAALPVPHFAAAMHPLVTLFTLIGALAVLRYQATAVRRYLALALAAALLTPYIHEAGIMAGALLALVWLVADWRQAWRQKWVTAVLPLVSALYLPVWYAVPKSGNETVGRQIDSLELLFFKITFFFQAPTYPWQPLAKWFIDTRGWRDLTAIWLVGGAGLLLAALILGRGRQWAALGLGVGWTAVAMLPAVVALPYDYISISPRLLYFTGVGAAVMWATVIVTLAAPTGQGNGRVWWRWAAAGGLLVLTTAVPVRYVQREVNLHVFALTPLRQMSRIAQERPAKRDIVINTTNWLAYKKQWYPIGNDGIAVLAPYLNTQQLIHLNSGVDWPVTIATFPDLRPDLPDYYLATAEEDVDQWWHMELLTRQAYEHDGVWLTQFMADGRSQVVYAGSLQAGDDQPPTGYQANFANAVFLTNSQYSLNDQTVTVSLDWIFTGPDPQATIFRHVLDCQGNLIGEGSGYALERMLPFTFLSPGDRIHDVKHINLEALPADGCLRVAVGLFRADGSRLTAYGADGRILPDASFILADQR
ncbi:MAG: hypothetical protein KBA85_01600 [Chloroflexi bacterium]|nr:hypothetical protein [Chloroflexota bacterium]